MTSHRCQNCGHVFDAQEPPKPLDLLTTTKTHIPLEDFTHVVCPSCGYKELAVERRFFGFLGPGGLRLVVGAIVLGVIVAVIYATLQRH